MDIKKYLKKLYDNRLLESSNQIHEFEDSLTKVLDYGDVSVIPDLCLAFDDDTEQFEVMFGLVHGIESLYKNNIEEGLTFIARSVPIIINQAKEWVEVLHYRILNHPQIRLAYGKVLAQLDPSIINIIKGLLLEIKNEDPEMFSKAVDEVISDM